MAYKFKMPAMKEGISEGKIVKWKVAVGEAVAEDATLVEIQNDKLTQAVRSPIKGTIRTILIQEKTTVRVGDVLAEIDSLDDSDVTSSANEKLVDQEVTKDSTTKSSTYVFRLPKVGEGIAEGKLVTWLVSVGDGITEDEAVVEVQNDKLLQEVPSPVSGILSKILVEAGNTAQIGDAIAEILVEESVSLTKEEKVDTTTQKIQLQSSNKQSNQSVVANRILAMPSVRQYARDKNVELTSISGSGKHGHITREDIDAFISNPVKENVIKETSEVKKNSIAERVVHEAYAMGETNNTTREKMSITRRAISRAMVNSKSHVVHVAIFDEVEVSKLITHLQRFKEIAENQDVKLTYLAYMTKALIAVLRKYPVLNASVDEAKEEIVYKNYFNIGFAVDTQRGLYVPNIKDADRKGIFTIAKEIADLASKAHEGTLEPIEMREGSTTITNVGNIGGKWFTPIINFPEVAIFGMGRIEKKPIVLEDDTLGIGSVLHLSMSFDHRIVDGAVAQRAMNELKRLLADPELLLMEG